MTALGIDASAFVPARLLGLVPPDGHPRALRGTALLADLVDFTGLTESWAGHSGVDAGEEVSLALNSALGPAVEAVLRHGGETVKFSGDGLLCIFHGSGQADAARAAAAELVQGAAVGPSGQLHRFRVALVCGTVILVRLGGLGSRYELVAGGEAVAQAHAAIALSAPGALPDQLELPVEAVDEAWEPSDAGSSDDPPSSYLPDFVRSRLAVNRPGVLRAFRTLTILFVAGPADHPGSALQAHALDAQRAIDRHGGQLLRFSLEGTDLVAEAAFGLAAGGSSTGPREAVDCAKELADAGQGWRCGLAMGRVFLGPVGTARRQQLTSLGSPVNFAARLMQRARPNEVLADEAMHAAARETWCWSSGRALFKGLGERAFVQVGPAIDAWAAPEEALIGRDAERGALTRWLDDAGEPPCAFIVEGEAGIGKSRFARWIEAIWRARGVAFWMAQATVIGRDSPFAGLRWALRGLCLPADQPAGQAATLRDLAAAVLGNAEHAPLLADALGLAMADTAATAPLVGRERADSIREAVVAVLRWRARSGPCGLIVDDAHWLDPASWALLQRVGGALGGWHVVLLTRPLTPPEPEGLSALRARGAQCMTLSALGAQDVAAVAARRLRISALPEDLARWIVDRARGNAFFAEELASMLAAKGFVEARGGELVRRPLAAELDALPSGPSIEGTLEQRIACLRVEDAVTLQVASVIGATFTSEDLKAVEDAEEPAGTAGSQLAAVLDRLVAANMALPAGPGSYAFHHRYAQEAAYRMLPGDQRRTLHRRMARRLEDRLGPEAEVRAAEVAHHWLEGGLPLQASGWLERAGQYALRTGADREAATHFERALSEGLGQPEGRRAAWHRQLARALFGLGDMTGVAREARRTIELVARPVPSGPVGWAWLSTVTTVGRLIGRSERRRTRSAEPADLLEGARAAGLLAEACYFLHAPEAMLGSALLAVGLAERARDAAPVAAAYGALGVLAGMGRLHTTARRYLARGRTVAESAGDGYQLGVAWFYEGMYHACRGDWQQSCAAANQALDLTEGLGAFMQSGFQYTLLASNALYTGDYAMARDWMATVRERALRSANRQQVGWACNVAAIADLHQGHLAKALELSAEAQTIFRPEHDAVSLVIARGVECAALARDGRLDEALAAAVRIDDEKAGARPSSWGQLEGFSGPCEAYAAALADGLRPTSRMCEHVRAARAGLRAFAWIFPFGRARHAWIGGLFAAAAGDERATRARLRRSAALAAQCRMPFDERLAFATLVPLLAGPERAAAEQRLQTLDAWLQETGEPAQAAPGTAPAVVHGV